MSQHLVEHIVRTYQVLREATFILGVLIHELVILTSIAHNIIRVQIRTLPQECAGLTDRHYVYLRSPFFTVRSSLINTSTPPLRAKICLRAYAISQNWKRPCPQKHRGRTQLIYFCQNAKSRQISKGSLTTDLRARSRTCSEARTEKRMPSALLRQTRRFIMSAIWACLSASTRRGRIITTYAQRARIGGSPSPARSQRQSTKQPRARIAARRRFGNSS
mmetsp:Transcript_41318/g.125031  ORF Transcript_41318/g.125031 Transcript_41318/m.125031 type:complete len:219 (-) Transcript_41318:1961-2617(-)